MHKGNCVAHFTDWRNIYWFLSPSSFFILAVVVVLRNVRTFKQLAETHSLDTINIFTHAQKNTQLYSIPFLILHKFHEKENKEEEEQEKKLSVTSCEKENHKHTYTIRQWKSVWTSRKENRNIEGRWKKLDELTSLYTSIHTVFLYFLIFISINSHLHLCELFYRGISRNKREKCKSKKNLFNRNDGNAWLFTRNVDWTGWKNRTTIALIDTNFVNVCGDVVM